MGLEQTARSVPLQQHTFARKTVLVLGKERDGISEAILQVCLHAAAALPPQGQPHVQRVPAACSAALCLRVLCLAHSF